MIDHALLSFFLMLVCLSFCVCISSLVDKSTDFFSRDKTPHHRKVFLLEQRSDTFHQSGYTVQTLKPTLQRPRPEYKSRKLEMLVDARIGLGLPGVNSNFP
jgi:hypothetical protein